MKKRLKMNTLSPIILSTVLIASTVSVGEAQAASKYKLKNGVLVVSKTEKKASGYATYKSALYSNGKKFTGTYKGAYYTSGMKRVATGAYKNAYYVKGIKK